MTFLTTPAGWAKVLTGRAGALGADECAAAVELLETSQQFVVRRPAITQRLDPAGSKWIFSCVQSGTKTSSVSDQP